MPIHGTSPQAKAATASAIGLFVVVTGIGGTASVAGALSWTEVR